MDELKFSKAEKPKIRNVPIAVTPEGFWCCPSHVVFQKTLKSQPPLNKPKPPPSPSSPPQSQPQPSSTKQPYSIPRKQPPASNDKKHLLASSDDKSSNLNNTANPNGERSGRSNNNKVDKVENLPRKVSIEFGEPGTRDMKVVMFGKHGFSVKLNVHKNVVSQFSSFFAEKVAEQESNGVCCVEIRECDDVEIYVETVGLMYCKEMKQRLIKQSVQRVLRILKVAEMISFSSCIQACLDYLEAVPWVGEEEEEKVVSSVLRLKNEGNAGVTPILKRVTSEAIKPPKDTLSYIIDMVLKSSEERGRREMKSIVLKLLKENTNAASSTTSETSPDICYETIRESCRSCLNSLLSQFRLAAKPELRDRPLDTKDPIARQIILQADNISWLLEILAERHAADDFAQVWASQQELACLHTKLATMNQYHVSCVTARLFVGIGKGELLPSKDIRHLLLQTWLQPLMNDYAWLQHGCRSFDRKVVEEGIGRTILTLPLEEQQSILLSWLGSFLKSGDSCPNLQRAFEVWWRRTFIRPYGEGRVGGSARRDQFGFLLTTETTD